MKKKEYVYRDAESIGKILAESMATKPQTTEEIAAILAENTKKIFKDRLDTDGYKYDLVGYVIKEDGTIILNISKSIEYVRFTSKLDIEQLNGFTNPELGEPFK